MSAQSLRFGYRTVLPQSCTFNPNRIIKNIWLNRRKKNKWNSMQKSNSSFDVLNWHLKNIHHQLRTMWDCWIVDKCTIYIKGIIIVSDKCLAKVIQCKRTSLFSDFHLIWFHMNVTWKFRSKRHLMEIETGNSQKTNSIHSKILNEKLSDHIMIFNGCFVSISWTRTKSETMCIWKSTKDVWIQ